jgi:tRNA (cmo5U34)-methyltransferase
MDAAALADAEEPADFISMFYLLQFLPTDKEKLSALRWAYRTLRPGGILFLGQKDLTTDNHTSQFSAEYYRFRMANGYSLGEIEAKTKALKNAMWPIHPAWLHDLCVEAGFTDYVETTRWLTFSTSMCTKQEEPRGRL